MTQSHGLCPWPELSNSIHQEEWSLDDYVDDLIAALGCERDAALWEMWDRIVNKRLLLIRQRLVDGKPCNPADGKPYNPEVVKPSYVRSNYNFNFDDNDRVKVISREWFYYRYTVAEPPRPPEAQPAADQQPEDKAGPDPSKKPKETVETRLINIMKKLDLESGMFPREVLKAVKQPYKDKYHDEPSQSAVTRAYDDYKKSAD